MAKINFWRPFLIYSKNAICHTYQSYEPILLFFSSKDWNTMFYLVSNFEKNRSINATMRVLYLKSAKKFKMAAMTSSYLKLKNQTKKKLANFLQIICGNFHQNRFILLGCRDEIDRLTERVLQCFLLPAVVFSKASANLPSISHKVVSGSCTCSLTVRESKNTRSSMKFFLKQVYKTLLWYTNKIVRI